MQEQIDFLIQQIEILQKTLDNTQTTNLQLKQQINTLQSKGVNMSEPVQQWEYKKIGALSDDASEENLNLLGQQGWEIAVAIASYQGQSKDLILKRPKKTPDYGYGR